MPPPELEYWSVPRLWEGDCVAILGGGESLTQEDIDHLRGKCRVIAINRAGLPRPKRHQAGWVSATWADWLFASDSDRFWKWHPQAVEFPGTKIVVRPADKHVFGLLRNLAAQGVNVIKHSGQGYPVVPKHLGISPDPGVVYGNNGVFMVLSVIHHTGASTVLLLGCDMGGQHWHGGYTGTLSPDFPSAVIPNFDTMVGPLEKAGVAVFNCSERSHLRCWPKVNLRDVLP